MVCLAALAVVGLAVPAAAQAVRLHTGSTRYVRLVHLPRRDLTVVLTASARKRLGPALRGRVLDATCTTLHSSVQGFTPSSQSNGAESSTGRHGRLTYHTLLDRRADFCDVGLARLTVTRHGESTSAESGPPVASIALSQKGAAYLDEDRVTQRILGVLDVAVTHARHDRGGHFPPARKIVAAFGAKVVALDAAEAAPPAGRIGFFSDGAEHAEVVATSALGHRLFVDSNAGVLSTNAQEHLFRVAGDEVAILPAQ